VLATSQATRDNRRVAHIIPEQPRAPGFPPKRQWAGLQPTVPAYDDPGFAAARRAWLAWWEFGKAMGFTDDAQ
jgi:hypothetical protein